MVSRRPVRAYRLPVGLGYKPAGRGSVGAYAGLNGPFVIATCPDHRLAGYLDNQLQGQVVSDTEDIAAMMAAWENVRGEALSHWQSVDLIRKVAETWS